MPSICSASCAIRRPCRFWCHLLKDPEVNYKVPWALTQIGDRRAIGPLINALDEDSASVRVAVIYALEAINAKEALPRLIALLDDHRPTNTGAGVSVADAARAAIAKLRYGRCAMGECDGDRARQG